MLKLEIEFHDASEAPPTPKRNMRNYLVAIRRANGQAYIEPATHIYDWPMFSSEDGEPICDECPEDGSHEDGCPQTGWGRLIDGDAEFFSPLLRKGDQLIAWASLPDWPEGEA